MRVPKDISLVAWIRKLMKEDTMYKFYKTDDWLELREDVLEENNYECVMCRDKGIYSKAQTVHHVNEVKQNPMLALSKYFIDSKGKQQKNLLPLCNKCHNEIHERFAGFGRTNKDKFTNEERW